MTTKLSVSTRGAAGDCSRSNRRPQHLDEHEQQEQQDRDRRHRLELAMAVGMVRVGRLARDAHADQRDDVRGAVGEGMKAVGEDADRAGQQAQRDLGDRDDEVENEDAARRTRETAA